MSKADTPRWRANTQSFIDVTLHEEGKEFDYQPPANGNVADNLSPVNDAAQAWIDAQKDAHPDKKAPAPAKAAPAPKADAKATKATKATKAAEADADIA